MIVSKEDSYLVNAEGENGRDDGYCRYITVCHTPWGEQGEGEEPKERSVGITTEHIDGIDDTRCIYSPEKQDKAEEEKTAEEMDPATQRHIVLPTIDINTTACGESCQC